MNPYPWQHTGQLVVTYVLGGMSHFNLRHTRRVLNWEGSGEEERGRGRERKGKERGGEGTESKGKERGRGGEVEGEGTEKEGKGV